MNAHTFSLVVAILFGMNLAARVHRGLTQWYLLAEGEEHLEEFALVATLVWWFHPAPWVRDVLVVSLIATAFLHVAWAFRTLRRARSVLRRFRQERVPDAPSVLDVANMTSILGACMVRGREATVRQDADGGVALYLGEFPRRYVLVLCEHGQIASIRGENTRRGAPGQTDPRDWTGDREARALALTKYAFDWIDEEPTLTPDAPSVPPT